MRKTDFAQLILLAFFVNILCQAAHESGHLLVYQAYGHAPIWGFIGLVQRWDSPPLHPENWAQVNEYEIQTGWLRLYSLPDGKTEKIIAAGAGPVASALSALLALAFSCRKENLALRRFAQMFVLSMSLGMSLYYLRSPWRAYGDEYDIAVELGIHKSALDLAFGLGFAVCLFFALKNLASWPLRLGWAGAAFLGSVLSGIILFLADGWVREMVNLENPFFQAVLGYSLPVFLVYLLAGLGAWFVSARGSVTFDST